MSQNDPNAVPPEGSAPPPGSPPPGSSPSPGSAPPPGQPLDYSAAPGGYTGPPPDADARTMGMLAHLLGIFVGFLGPLIIWLVKKDTSPFVDDQGKEALNFQLTVLIAWIVSSLTCLILIGFVLVPAVAIVNLVFCIIAALEANKGNAYRYPVNIRFIK